MTLVQISLPMRAPGYERLAHRSDTDDFDPATRHRAKTTCERSSEAFAGDHLS
jgi:hypothetical protein